jgi:hypothetical protein
MDARKVSPAVRRRVGEPSSTLAMADGEGVVHSTPIETDWRIIEAAFEAKRTIVPRDYTGGPV